MVQFFRVRLGRANAFSQTCFIGNYIGVDYGVPMDLTGHRTPTWQAFNQKFIPQWLEQHPTGNRIGAGLACGALWTLAAGMHAGDRILSPDGLGRYRLGIVDGEYRYAPTDPLPHQRPVKWTDTLIETASLSQELSGACKTPLTIVDLLPHVDELVRLTTEQTTVLTSTRTETVATLVAFALEKHLEEFLIKNWGQVALLRDFRIYEEDGEQVGQQFPTDTGPIDILAQSLDGKRLLVVELKKGRASDAVVGQILRYMGFVKQNLTTQNQTVEGLIVALEPDQRIQYALAALGNVKFCRYEIDFKLVEHA
jgi:restriction system protein